MVSMVDQLSQLHNVQIPSHYPTMKETIRPDNTKDAEYKEWLWTMDHTIQTAQAPCE